jgi:3D (Asp-Asp-Asp) domain-containing protein
MKNKQQLGIGLAICIVISMVGYFVMYPGKEPKTVVYKYPFEIKSINLVSLTTYKTATNETDSEPLITASGLKLDSLNPIRHRVIAVSRDLKELFSFGDKVKLTNAGKFNGIWFIHDLMNKKWKNKIDILINPSDPQVSLEGVVISKI